MRLLLAIDGSISSDRARDLVASLPLPAGSRIRVAGVLEHGSQSFALAWIPVAPAPGERHESEDVARLRTAVETAERVVARPGVGVDHVLLTGHPVHEIVDEARAMGADLVVVGSRGHSGLETAVLGSTSSGILDHAPCPVLVVRRARIESILLAEDGSAGAAGAARILEAWPIFAGLPVTVLSVAEGGVSWVGAGPGIGEQVIEPTVESLETIHRQHVALAERRADELGGPDHLAIPVVRDGDPAPEIVAAAAADGTDLIVMGTRGHTGLARMILGSVARHVLVHAPCSVLVVREGVEPTADDAVAAPVAELSGRSAGR